MNKSHLLILGLLASLFLSGCVEGVYTSGSYRSYGGGSAYGGHRSGYYRSSYDDDDYDSEPVFVRREYVTINDRSCYVPLYRHRGETYYNYGGQRYGYGGYSSHSDYSAPSQNHSGYVSRDKLRDSENHRREEMQRYQDRLRSDRAKYEQKARDNRQKSSQSSSRSSLEQARKDNEARARLRNAEQSAKQANYRADHSGSSNDKDKKKKH